MRSTGGGSGFSRCCSWRINSLGWKIVVAPRVTERPSAPETSYAQRISEKVAPPMTNTITSRSLAADALRRSEWTSKKTKKAVHLVPAAEVLLLLLKSPPPPQDCGTSDAGFLPTELFSVMASLGTR